MTRIECLTGGLTALARHSLTLDDGMILLNALQFDGVTRKQIERIVGRELPTQAMVNLVRQGLVFTMGKQRKLRRWSATEKGRDLINELLGKVPA
jgi:hypothetical protein